VCLMMSSVESSIFKEKPKSEVKIKTYYRRIVSVDWEEIEVNLK
jgi:hypothetical protein